MTCKQSISAYRRRTASSERPAERQQHVPGASLSCELDISAGFRVRIEIKPCGQKLSDFQRFYAIG